MYTLERTTLFLIVFFLISGVYPALSQAGRRFDIAGIWTRHGDVCDGEQIVIRAGRTPSGIAKVSASHRCNGFSEAWASQAPRMDFPQYHPLQLQHPFPGAPRMEENRHQHNQI